MSKKYIVTFAGAPPFRPSSDLTEADVRRIRRAEREEGLAPPDAPSPRKRPSRDQLPHAERSLEARVAEHKIAIGEAPPSEYERVKHEAKGIDAAMHGRTSNPEVDARAAEISSALYGRAPDPEADRRAAEMKRTLYGR